MLTEEPLGRVAAWLARSEKALVAASCDNCNRTPHSITTIAMGLTFCEPEIRLRISRFTGLVESSNFIPIRKKVRKSVLKWILFAPWA